MKVKTFILTFLMMMSSPFLFGQHWEDPGNTGYQNTMNILAQINLDDVLQEGEFEVAAFYGDKLLGVSETTNVNGTPYHVHLMVQGDNSLQGINFRFYNGEKEFVSSTEINFTIDSQGSHSNYFKIDFYSVAQIGDVVYPTLQKAIDACKEGDNTIELLADNAEDVTIKQVEGVNVTIDGGTSRYEYSGTITIHGNARHDGAETLTFQNINFKTDKAGHYFIDSNSTGSVERYAHNVTVSNCNFTATGAGVNSAAAMRIRQGFDIAINGSTFTNLHSALQAYGNAGITVSGITLNGKNGISAGTSTGVVIENSNITATGYGVRADGTGAYDMTLSGANTITADLPVVVRNTTGAYELKVESGTTLNGNPAVTFTTGDDGTFVAPTSPATSDLADGISTFGFEAKIGTVYHTTFVNAYAAAAAGDVITLLKDQNFSEIITLDKAITLDGGNYILTSTAGRAINVDCAGEVTIKNLTIVGSTGCERGINIIDQAGITNIENVTISGQSHYAIHMATSAGAATVNVKNSNLTGYGAFVVYGKGSVNTIENSTLVGINTYDDNGSNNFGTIVADVENTTITVTGGNITAKAEEGKAGMAIFTGKNGNNANVTLNSTLALEGAAKYTGILNETTTLKVKAEYATAIQAEGFATSDPDNGLVKVEGVAVAKIGETKYATLAKAITAAQTNDVIVLLADITENVTVNKNVTIDGDEFAYTGTMEGNAGLTITIQHVNFVGGGFAKNTKSATGTYTFKNCTFEDDGDYAYAFIFKGASSVTIEDCTVKNYLYSFLYITSGTNKVSVKNVTVEDCQSYAVYFASGVNTATIENLTVKNSNNGFVINNTANRALTLKNCKLENVTNAINHANGTNTITCTLLGNENDFGTSASSQYAKYVLEAADATLTAPEGLNVTTSVVNSLVKYENEKYVVKPAVAKIGEKYYETLTEAINAADDGATIQLLPVTINEYVAPWITDTQHTSEKSITIVGSKDDEGKLATTLTAGMYLGYDDSQCREHTIVVKDVKFEGKGLKVACQQNVTIEGNQFDDITEGQAIAVVGKNIKSVVKNNVIDGVTTSNPGIELRNTLTATVEGNIISNTGHNALQITSQVDATASEINVINNTMSNWGTAQNAQGELEGRAMRINDIVTANINGNVMSHTAAPEEFVKVTGSTTLDASANYWNGVSPLTDGMFTGVEGDLVPVLKSYYTDAEKQNLVVLSPSVAKIGEEYYPSLAAAVSAAQQDNTITLLADIAEDVTIENKRLTIDGGGFNSTGLISTHITTAYPLTFQNFNIDGASSYFVKVTGGGGNYIFDNCNIKNSLGLIYTNKSTNIVTIKNLTVEDCSCAVNFVYLNTATFENVNLVNTQYGIHVKNNSAKTINIKGCDLNTENPLYIQNNSNSTITFQFEGVTDVNNNELALYNYGNLVFTTADAKLINAQEGLVVTTTVEGCVVEYEAGETPGFGTYSVIPANVELVRGETSVGKFATIQDAIDAAENGDKVVVLEDVDLSTNQFVTLDNSYNTYFKVEGKAVTIDLNGKTISGEYAITSPWLVGVFSTDNNGHLTLEDNVGTAKVDITGENGEVYALIVNYKSGCSITINGGTYKLDKARDSHMYTACNEGIIVNGGTFQLGNSGTGSNGQPWMFNAKGQNTAHVIVNGGTFNTDILHQYYAFEVSSARENALVYNESEKTWTVVKDGAVAYVEERYTTFSSGYSNEVGYATLADAVAAANKYDKNGGWLPTITLLANVELENTITIAAGKEVILDLNGKTISGVCNSGQGHMFMVQNTADLTVKDSSENKNGKITYARGTSNTGWVIDLEGDLILESGTIELTGDSWSIGYAVDVRPNSWGSEYTEATTFTMNGGKLVSSDAAVRVASSSADDHENVSANFIMNGGEIEAAWDGIFVQQSNAAYDILNVRINGGNIKSELSPLRLYGPAATSVLNNVENPITLNITGGTFDYTGSNLEDTRWLVPGVIMVSGGATFEQMLDYTDFEITGGTFDGDVNDYCAEGFAAVNNGDGTWTVMPVQEQSLVAGWNWYSSYLNITTENLLGALGTNGRSIVQNSTWSADYMDGEWICDDHAFDVSKMYMIETSQTCELALSGNLVDASEITITLNPGWNWIGYPSNVEVKLEDALRNLTPNEGDIIKNKTNSFAEYYGSKWLDGTATGMIMEPTKGYMYHNSTNETKTFTYNIVPIRGNNERLADNHYVVDYTKYPFNMTMTAVVDGAIGDNYEVAALVNGEVRGSARPVYVEVLDAYMLFLTISGDNVEEVSFKYYDLTTGEEYDLVNRIDYSNNAMVGSVNEPYVLSRGTTGIGDATMSQVNIYPNPTTTGTEINLEATCDKVEVFNALGVKVVEYHNVDSIDALETAGIYVIRITNNGNVQNCRLVVK